MNPRVYLLTALLVSPAWAQEPASFDLTNDSIKKIVHDAAAAQFADVRVVDQAPVESEPAAFRYVPPEKQAAPMPEPPQKLPTQPEQSNDFVSALFGILADELLGIEDYDEIAASNLMLRCEVLKDIKSLPSGPACPSEH